MIVIVGQPLAIAVPPGVDGPAARTAIAAARMGGRVELVGKAGDDPEGDAVLLALARAGVGHAALLRDPSRRTPVLEPVADADSDDLLDEADDASQPLPFLRQAVAERPVLEPADLELALRYLPEIQVIVLAEPVGPDLVSVAAEAASYAGAHLVVLAEGEGSEPDVPPGCLVLQAPARDPDGIMATLVGEYAAAVDAGMMPGEAYGRLRDRLSGTAAAGG